MLYYNAAYVLQTQNAMSERNAGPLGTPDQGVVVSSTQTKAAASNGRQSEISSKATVQHKQERLLCSMLAPLQLWLICG